MPQKLTIRDVATRAGVSYQTVSRVINDRPDVAEGTRQRVKQIIAELGYRPNRAAKSLAGRQSCVLGAIVRGLNYFGPAQLMAEAEFKASQEGYDLLVDSVSTNATEDEVRAAIEQMDGWSVDGILINVDVPAELMQRFAHIPIVQTELCDNRVNLPAVYVDNEHGIRQAVEYLIALGHTRIAEISGPIDWGVSITRHQKLHDILVIKGLRPGPSMEGDWSVDSGYDMATRLLDAQEPFTAIMAANDEMAIGAIHALQDHGLVVPADISVIGFDDVPLVAHIRPPLTTIRQDFKGFGSEAIGYLLELIKVPDSPPEQRPFLPELIVRDSTAPPP